MKYVFDFDRVLFDTDRFRTDLEAAGLYQPGTARTVSLLDAAAEQGIHLSAYVLPVVREFLQAHPGQCAIVSSSVSRHDENNLASEAEAAAFQTEKIKRSGLADLVARMEVVGRDKDEALAELYEPGAIYLDDELVHLTAARAAGFDSYWLSAGKKALASNLEASPTPEQNEFRSFNSFHAFVEYLKTIEEAQQ